MRIHDLLAALSAASDDETLSRSIMHLAQGAEPGHLSAMFDLALRTGALPHDLAWRLRQRLRALAEVEGLGPDEATQSLREEVQVLQAKVADHHVTQSSRVALKSRVASLEQRRSELTTSIEVARREVTELEGQKGRLDQILSEVEP